ncbi:MAG TPA: PE-PPE domain-containing protein [Mycobacterium sp.]|nr:PE-PPE domain-containing protein [Mycobacterium sp.]
MSAAFAFAEEDALFVGYTGAPTLSEGYMASACELYIPNCSAYTEMPVTYPAQFWPLTPDLGNMTFGQSVAEGVADLNNQLMPLLNAGDDVYVYGHSQGVTVATGEMYALDALPASQQPSPDQVSFVFEGDPNNPDGGILERLDGLFIPILNIPFNGATPPDTPYPTDIYTGQYDGVADTPRYPLNLLADLNAIMGVKYVHPLEISYTPQQIADAVPEAVSPGYTGDTHYFMLLTQNLPLLEPLRQMGGAWNVIADLIQPDLRVLVDLGYGNIGDSADFANIPTPASLVELINPVTVVFDLAKGAVQGVVAALVDLGWLPVSDLPDTYPYVPSLDPGLSFDLGQPSQNLLTLITGALGSLAGYLGLIPSDVAGSVGWDDAGLGLDPTLAALDPVP